MTFRSRFGDPLPARVVTAFFMRGRHRPTPKILARLDQLAAENGGRRLGSPVETPDEVSVDWYFPARAGAAQFLGESNLKATIVAAVDSAEVA
jgi:hypothetical protein